MQNLLVISSTPVEVCGDDITLDDKFIEGMSYYSKLWAGNVGCLILDHDEKVSFGKKYDVSKLPFTIKIKKKTESIDSKDIENFDIILASGDSSEQLFLADYCKNKKEKVVFAIENTLDAKIDMLYLDKSRGFIKKAYSVFWLLKHEILRRRAFRQADGLQFNGYPAYYAYSNKNWNILQYLDNRIGDKLLATNEEMAARQRRSENGDQLNLIHSGRLEPIKGSQDLIPIACKLMYEGIDYKLNIFGSGSLEDEIKNGIIKYGLQDRVFLHGPVNFETELVPYARTQGDAYLSCHRQSDPSCTYLESMGCGLAVIGYGNSMWSSLWRDSGAGWAVPLADLNALCKSVVQASENRFDLNRRCVAAREFAGAHTFEREFGRRIEHLRAIANRDP
ncbi:glycosyltransferase [Sphingopyxis granuli]|uniref:glycosyltransferase n=1 Tax=Sphingopyxis granuli TaxID=267128 RepID=UPI001BAFD87F|nr:glycosyltransferase [Sphingopyxis granuli]QUM72731.1 glycosyltransferase [Sphingopyxis granuli]